MKESQAILARIFQSLPNVFIFKRLAHHVYHPVAQGGEPMVATTTIYHDKAKELGNMLLASDAYRRFVDAKAAFGNDLAAQELDQKIADFNNSLQTGIRMGALSTDDYRSAIAEIANMERELKENPSVQEYLAAEEAYNEFISSVMGILDKIVTNLNKSVEGGPKMCSCGSNPGGPCYSACGSSASSSGGCGSGCSCV